MDTYSFGTTLSELRKSLGHKSAKSFYRYLEEKLVDTPLNYPYYARIEKGKQLPTASIVEAIAALLPTTYSEALVKSYCRSLLPSQSHLFPMRKTPLSNQDSTEAKTGVSSGELNLRQMHLLSKSKAHYYLFLFAHTINESFSFERAQRALREFWKPRVLKELGDEGLVHLADKEILPFRGDLKLPKANSEELRKIYSRFDKWEEQFREEMDFETLINKVTFRRISARNAEIINKQIEVLLAMMRAADEVQPQYNEELYHLRLELSRASF